MTDLWIAHLVNHTCTRVWRWPVVSAAVLALLLSLSACGGGSGGSDVDTGADATGVLESTDTQHSTPPVLSPAQSTDNTGGLTANPDLVQPEATTGATTQEPATTNDTSTPGTIDSSNVLAALATGDAGLATEAQLLEDAIAAGEQQVEQCLQTLAQVYPDGLTPATMPYLANYVYSTRAANYPLHVAGDSGAVYSWLGQHAGGSRYVYYGAGILTDSDSHYWGNLGPELADNTLAVMAWLMQFNTTDELSNASLQILALNLRAQTQLQNWQQMLGLNTDWQISTNVEDFPQQRYDLVVGLAGGSLPDIDNALANAIPVMLWSEVFDPGAGIHKLGLHWNWWGEEEIGNSGSVAAQCKGSYPFQSILTTLQSMQNNALDFNYNSENCPLSLYTRRCIAVQVTRSDGTTLQQAFLSGAEKLQRQLARLDANGISVFDNENSDTLTQLAVLLGDKFRSRITYPMDYQNTPAEDYYRALFADYANHYARTNIPAQTDSGDYSPHFLRISELSATPGHIVLEPTAFSEWNSTGFTARAGKSVTLTRVDDNPMSVSVRMNMLRSQSTWIWNDDGYTRPLFVTSHAVGLAAGDSITISSPIGGPLYIYWDGSEDTATLSTPVNIRIEGAVKHPFLSAFDATAIDQFFQQLQANVFDWVDIKTPFAEVHSLRSSMVNAFDAQDNTSANSYNSADVQQWIHNLNTYLIDSALSLAGFVHALVTPMNASVSEFCQASDLACADEELHRKPALQHINADHRASCGDLCSGNPFDTNSAVNPLGYGESHEMGHNLQRHRLNFHGARSIETSNNIFPLYSAWRWLADQAQEKHPTIRLPDPAKAYQQVQQSIALKSEPGIGHPIWAESQIYVNADVRLMLYLQLIYIHHQWEANSSTGATGWDIFTKLYKLERQYTQALSSGAQWLASRDKLGFSHFSREAAQSISSNDFMAIALSYISRRSHRQYLNAWGIEISGDAQAQIDANGPIASIPLVFWRTPDDRYARRTFPSDNPANSMPLDGTTTW